MDKEGGMEGWIGEGEGEKDKEKGRRGEGEKDKEGGIEQEKDKKRIRIEGQVGWRDRIKNNLMDKIKDNDTIA